jgi:hypothetical protein
MSNVPQGGAPPPDTRDRGPAPTGTADLKNTLTNSANYSTTRRRLEASSTIDAEMRPIQDLEDWGERVGIPVVPITGFHLEKLVAAGVPAWIAYDYWCCDEEELAFAIGHATQVVIADDVDRFNHVAAGLALEGERVLLLDWPEGAPLPLPGGNRSECGAK